MTNIQQQPPPQEYPVMDGDRFSMMWSMWLKKLQQNVNSISTTAGAPGPAGPPGANGSNGLNTAMVFLYKRSASVPAVPSVTSTYTFASGILTGYDNGWAQSVPTINGNPCYITTAAALASAATDTIATGEWAAPTILAQDGANGLNNATVTLYKRATSLPSVPSVTSTYTFATGVLTGFNNGWSQTIPTSDGTPLYVTIATASGNGTTDTIATGEWATPTIQVNETVPFIARNNCAVFGSIATKVGGSSAWDSDVYSAKGYLTCHVSFKANSNTLNFMVGLNTDPTTDQSYTSIDYAWYCTNAGTLQIYEGGALIGSFGNYDTTTLLEITYDASNVRYYKNAILQRTVAIASQTFFMDSSFYDPNASCNSLTFGPTTGFEVVDTAQIGSGAATDTTQSAPADSSFHYGTITTTPAINDTRDVTTVSYTNPASHSINVEVSYKGLFYVASAPASNFNYYAWLTITGSATYSEGSSGNSFRLFVTPDSLLRSGSVIVSLAAGGSITAALEVTFHANAGTTGIAAPDAFYKDVTLIVQGVKK